MSPFTFLSFHSPFSFFLVPLFSFLVSHFTSRMSLLFPLSLLTTIRLQITSYRPSSTSLSSCCSIFEITFQPRLLQVRRKPVMRHRVLVQHWFCRLIDSHPGSNRCSHTHVTESGFLFCHMNYRLAAGSARVVNPRYEMIANWWPLALAHKTMQRLGGGSR